MTYENMGYANLDYYPCRYGASKLLFRGPQRQLTEDYVAFLGGIETYGKFVDLPLSALVEHEAGIKSINLGCVNAGIDVYLTDHSLVNICANAKVTVIQVMGAQNMSNRFYAVHPRRNDRFLRASSSLTTIYNSVDFTEFNFTRHLLNTLHKAAPRTFSMIEEELKGAWVTQMRSLIQQIDGKVVLVWLADHAPETASSVNAAGPDPLFVDRQMIEQLSRDVSDVIEIVATQDEIAIGLDEMIYGSFKRPAAEGMLGPVVHRRAASAIAKSISALI